MNTMDLFDPNAGNVDLFSAPSAGVAFDPVYSTNNGTGIDFGIGVVNDLVGGALQTWMTVERIKAQKSLIEAKAYQDSMLSTPTRSNNPGAQPLPPPAAVSAASKPPGGDPATLLMIVGAGLMLAEVLG